MSSDSLSVATYQRLKADIVTCELRPGQYITESELAARYNVSKSPIRFALALLSAEELLTVAARRGIQIAPLTLNDVQSIYTMRGLLEPFASGQAALHRNEEDLESLEILLHDASSETRHALHRDQIRAHSQFHIRLAQTARIPRLARLIQTLHESMERLLNSLPSVGESSDFGTHDRELLDAIRAGDALKASALAGEHIALAAENTKLVLTRLMHTPSVAGWMPAAEQQFLVK